MDDTNDDCLVIGDVHGHLLRLVTLLAQEGLIDPETDERLRPEIRVIQLGDLGHFGMERGTGQLRPKSPTEDLLCYTLAQQGVLDEVLWGNHDRAVIDSCMAFGGYVPPPFKTCEVMDELIEAGILKLAAEAHGFLLTHAGLHKQWSHNDVPAQWKTDPAVLAEAFNRFDYENQKGETRPEGADKHLNAARDAISVHRGGRMNAGGILWRDAAESLYGGFRQIFGHTAKDATRKYQTPSGYSHCIDVGSATNGRLAAIWLPSETIVEVCVHATGSSARP